MNYKLFIDDEREPIGGDWVIARSHWEAIEIIIRRGMPKFISFDHDLGDGPTGYDFAKWLIETDLDQKGKLISTDFEFYVHSQNPIGKKNIENLFNNYLRHKKWQA